MVKVFMAIFIVLGSILVLLAAHWWIWSILPPISTHSLATGGRFIPIQGIETYYENQGSGQDLILVTPGGSHTSTWEYNVPALSKKYRVWTLDLPGSGLTEKPPTFAYTHQAYAAFLKSFMDAMGIDQAVVGGQSLGGTVALKFGLDYPEKLLALILIDSGGYPHEKKPGILTLNRNEVVSALLMSFSSYPFIVKAFLTDMYFNPAPFQNDDRRINEACAINRTPNSRAAWYWMPKALQWDFTLPDWQRIPSITLPTLILWGENDKIVGVKDAERFHQDIKNSVLKVIGQAGHGLHEEQPEQVNRAILTFLDGLKRRSP